MVSNQSGSLPTRAFRAFLLGRERDYRAWHGSEWKLRKPSRMNNMQLNVQFGICVGVDTK
ncbi:hypothetical protein AGR1A_Lc40261 [Agrobacterium fabacearum CFBP 5771]|nr:hypothetical protein AGR1A_Lc40261 [Agrobacterium fabacearum CFBP 5771]